MKPIYLDYNATTPVDPEVAEEMTSNLTTNFGNPSSNHYYGIKAKNAIEQARQNIAFLINCKPSEIIFTSGGTESNNYAIKGMAYSLKTIGNHIITTKIEHPSVIETCHYLENSGFELSLLDVDKFGMVSPESIEKAIKKTTILISVMHANNEIGTLQPIDEIGEIALKHGITYHSDAAQSVGKVMVDVQKSNLNLLSIAGHKFYAPKGVGALYIKEGTFPEKFMHGASHENNKRAGTENVNSIVGLGKAAEIALRDFSKNNDHQITLRNLLHEILLSKNPSMRLNGHPELRLPNTLSVAFSDIHAADLLVKIKGIAASTGPACHSRGNEVSKVLLEIGLPLNYAHGTIRFSTGKYLTEKDIEIAADLINTEILLEKNNIK